MAYSAFTLDALKKTFHPHVSEHEFLFPHLPPTEVSRLLEALLNALRRWLRPSSAMPVRKMASRPSTAASRLAQSGRFCVWWFIQCRSTDQEADLYEGRAVGNVLRALRLVPDEVRTLKALSTAHYLPMGRVREPGAAVGTLNRMPMELIAGRVAALRQCFY